MLGVGSSQATAWLQLTLTSCGHGIEQDPSLYIDPEKGSGCSITRPMKGISTWVMVAAAVQGCR